MQNGSELLGGVLLALGAGVALVILARQRRRWKKRARQLKSRNATLERALAQAERTLAACKSNLKFAGDPDRWLRTFLETEHSLLADPATPDLVKIEWLRHWVYVHVPHCAYGQHLDPLEFDIVHKPLVEVLRELLERKSGFLCGGTAWILYRVYEIFGYPACTLNIGGSAHGIPSHMLTVVEIPSAGGPLWSVQDPYFDFTLEDGRGRPLDIRRALEHLSWARMARLQVRETQTPKACLVLPSNQEAVKKLEACGAQELERYGVHRCFMHPHSLSLYRILHPEAFQKMRNQFAQDFLLLLLFLPLNIHGAPCFHALSALAAEKLREYREGQEALYLIYTIGKTGSQTIEQTLLRAGLPGSVRRTHFLSRRSIRENAMPAGSAAATPAQANEHTQAAHARSIRRLLIRQRAFRRKVPGLSPIRVICGVREPIGQLLSRLFQNPLRYLGSPDGFTPHQVSAFLEKLVLEAAKGLSREEATAWQSGWAHSLYFTTWFDDELRTVLGLDVFASPFAWARGCQVYETPEARVLVYRQEDLSRLSAVLAEFVGAKHLALVNTNLRGETDMRGLYEQCRRECRFSEALLDTLYDSRYGRHFYSPQELAGFRAHWRVAPSQQPFPKRECLSDSQP